MKNMIRFITYSFICFFSFILVSKVDALKIVTYGEFTNGTWGGGGGKCYGDTYVCWNGEQHHNGFFRLTLVDKNGKKVEGTKSVNISGNPFYDVNGNFKLYNYRSISTPYGSSGDYFSYKFNNGDISDMTYISDKSTTAFVYDPRFPIYSYSSFDPRHDLNYFTKNILENVNVDCTKNRNDCYDDVSFYDYFLRLSGFLDEDQTVFDLEVEIPEEYKKLLSYFVIIEPGYPLWWQARELGGITIYRYGTVNEWAQYIKNNPSSLVANTHRGHLFSNAGACISDANQLKMIQDHGFSADLTVAGICNSSYTRVDDFISKAYGVSLSIPLPDPTIIIENPPDETTNEQLFFKMNFCDQNAGKLVFSSYGNVENNPLILKNGNINLIGRDADDNKKIYCYDDVEYDFSETIDDLSKSDLSKNSFINPRTSKINVTRHCLLGSSAEYSSVDVENSIESFKNAKLKIKYYDNDVHEFSIKNEPISISSSLPRQKGDYTYVTFTFSLNFDITDDTLFVGSNGGLKNAYIELSNWENSFGLSSKLLSTLTIFDDEYRDSLTSLPKDDAMKCHFDFNVLQKKSNINFRVISLDNPFPARDGSSRMPSENWLYADNNVFNYITNNRGIRLIAQSDNVSPEEIYKKVEPMYTVTLTPSIMLKIRSYNQDYSYYSMYSTASGLDDGNKKMRKKDAKADKLVCNEDGRECISTFLRNLSNEELSDGRSPVGGICFFDRSEANLYTETKFMESDMLNLYTSIYVSKISKYSSDDAKYDLNKNYRLDSEDYELLMNYLKNDSQNKQQNNSKYYTCANKTYKSGGPVEEENE